MLSGCVLIIQEDFWENRNIVSSITQGQTLLSNLAVKNIQQNEKLFHLGQRTNRVKLLSYFSMMAQQCGNSEFDIPYSHQQLADYLSVERSGLSLELGKMRREGLLDFNKNHFILLQ